MPNTLAAQPLDPRTITATRWCNRDPASFTTLAFANLKADIAYAGGNDQAIKVRALNGPKEDGARYEIVFGHRRHRACLELGLPVNAVIVQFMSDQDLYLEMERENRYREDPSPWEQGVRYSNALNAGLFPSRRLLAQAIGKDVSKVSKAIGLAALPSEVIGAFGSPLDLQLRWATALKEAIQKDPEGVLGRARTIPTLWPRPAPSAVFSMLVSKRKMP